MVTIFCWISKPEILYNKNDNYYRIYRILCWISKPEILYNKNGNYYRILSWISKPEILYNKNGNYFCVGLVNQKYYIIKMVTILSYLVLD